MIRAKYSYLLLLLFFLGCFERKAIVSDGLISFEMPKHLLVDEVLHFIKPAVDRVIEEEIVKIRTKENKDRLIDQIGFHCKDQFRLTVAYVSQYQNKCIDQLSDLVKNIALEQHVGKAYLAAHVDFFGKDQNAFVIKIDDRNQYLSSLNQKIKCRLHQENHDFFDADKEQLYSIEKSEAFEYSPHLHLATLYIRSEVKSEMRVLLEPVLATIFQRVRSEIFPQVNQIIENSKNKKIEIQALSFVNLTGRDVVITEKLHHQ